MPEWIEAQWPAPPGVRAVTTTRHGGVSRDAWATLNLARHVGDEPERVAENRRRLQAALGLPAPPCWLEQTHGTAVADADHCSTTPRADAAIATRPGAVCAVLTADCLPVVISSGRGERIGVAHAGWRGLLAGVIGRTVERLQQSDDSLMAWLGPAIGPECFEVGEEVRTAFIAADPGAADAFRPSPAGRWLADLYALARRTLSQHGVHAVYGGEHCTFTDANRFFSYRRDGVTGRQATLVWRE